MLLERLNLRTGCRYRTRRRWKMANPERWLLRFLVRRQVARGFNDGRAGRNVPDGARCCDGD